MSQNIDMDPTTQSVTPITFAEGQAKWLADGLGGDVYVRTNEWYNKNPPYDVWAVVQVGSGQTAGASRIVIGPGSYYTGDNTITMIHEEIKDEQSAFEFVSSFDDTNNQVVIFQLGPFGSNPNEQVLMVHFKKFHVPKFGRPNCCYTRWLCCRPSQLLGYTARRPEIQLPFVGACLHPFQLMVE